MSREFYSHLSYPYNSQDCNRNRADIREGRFYLLLRLNILKITFSNYSHIYLLILISYDLFKDKRRKVEEGMKGRKKGRKGSIEAGGMSVA